MRFLKNWLLRDWLSWYNFRLIQPQFLNNYNSEIWRDRLREEKGEGDKARDGGSAARPRRPLHRRADRGGLVFKRASPRSLGAMPSTRVPETRISNRLWPEWEALTAWSWRADDLRRLVERKHRSTMKWSGRDEERRYQERLYRECHPEHHYLLDAALLALVIHWVRNPRAFFRFVGLFALIAAVSSLTD